MNITHTLALDLQRLDAQKFIFSKQGDSETRSVEISLYENGTPWQIPDDVAIVQICYAKPDHTGGLYDHMPDGSVACVKSDNRITAKLHPQMFTVSGTVIAEARLLSSEGKTLVTFNWYLHVEGSPSKNIKSKDYFNATPLGMIGDLLKLATENKTDIVSAVNEVSEIASAAKETAQRAEKNAASAVKTVNGKTPRNGAVTVTAEDVMTQQKMFYFQGSLTEAIDEVYGQIPTGVVKRVNGVYPQPSGLVELTSGDIPADGGDYAWSGSMTDALDVLYNMIVPLDTAEKRSSAGSFFTGLFQIYDDGETGVPVLTNEANPITRLVPEGVAGEAGSCAVPTTARVKEMISTALDKITSYLPIIGRVDNDNNIIITSSLAEGTYILRYENSDGTTTDIGTIEVERSVQPENENLILEAKMHTDLTSVFNSVGYKNGAYASSASPYYGTDAATVCTGAIPATAESAFYIKGVTLDVANSHVRVGVAATNTNGTVNNYAVKPLASMTDYVSVETIGENYYKMTFNTVYLNANCPNFAWFFFSAIGTGDHLIVSKAPIV